jgi:hypothetical protein
MNRYFVCEEVLDAIEKERKRQHSRPPPRVSRVKDGKIPRDNDGRRQRIGRSSLPQRIRLLLRDLSDPGPRETETE